MTHLQDLLQVNSTVVKGLKTNTTAEANLFLGDISDWARHTGTERGQLLERRPGRKVLELIQAIITNAVVHE